MSELIKVAESQREGALVKKINSFTELRNYEPEIDKESVILLGGPSFGDINGGIFRYDSGSVLADDNNNTIVTVGGARWRRLNLAYASVAQGSKADSAVQPGANISAFVNDSGFITAAGAPVQSVNAQTGVVTISREGLSAEKVFSVLPIAGTAITLTAAHDNTLLLFDEATLVTITLPEQLTETIETNVKTYFRNKGAGQIALAIQGTDTLINGATTVAASVPNFVYLEDFSDPNVWVAVGDFV